MSIERGSRGERLWLALWAAVLSVLTVAPMRAQGRQGAPPAAPPTPQAASPIDLTGSWVSVITQDWRYRMVTPTKGDFAGLPLTNAAIEAANSWDPVKDDAASLQCKSYGAAAIMLRPGRLRIGWQDDRTLKIETDAGTQTRVLRFGNAAEANAPGGWQGTSVAEWVTPPRPGGRQGRGGAPGGAPAGAPAARTGSLKVVTTGMRAGYLRKNGVPYSENAVLTEYFDIVAPPGAGRRLIVTITVEDPMYLQQPYMAVAQFKAQADGSGWDPTPCSSTW
jgi:hypothetical protein